MRVRSPTAGRPRIRPVDQPTAEQAAVIAKAPTRSDGTTRNIFATLAWHPQLLTRFNAFAGVFFRFGRLSAYDRELLVLRVACRTRCGYELAQHVELAREAGLADSTMLAVLEQPEAPSLGRAERLLVDAVDRLCASGSLDDHLWDRLAERYDEAQMLEVISIVGFYRYAADLLNVVGIEPEDRIDLRVSWMAEASPELGEQAFTEGAAHGVALGGREGRR